MPFHLGKFIGAGANYKQNQASTVASRAEEETRENSRRLGREAEMSDLSYMLRSYDECRKEDRARKAAARQAAQAMRDGLLAREADYQQDKHGLKLEKTSFWVEMTIFVAGLNPLVAMRDEHRNHLIARAVFPEEILQNCECYGCIRGEPDYPFQPADAQQYEWEAESYARLQQAAEEGWFGRAAPRW